MQRLILVSALCCLVAPVVGAQAEKGDQQITEWQDTTREPSCPGGECGETALGRSSEGLTSPSGLRSTEPALVPCAGDACGTLPAAGEFGGITREGGKDEGEPKETDDGGINKMLDSGFETGSKASAKALAGPLCGGNNHTDNDFVNTTSMGGPVVGIEWIPSTSMTVTGIEVFTGEHVGPNALALWSDSGGASPQPAAVLGASAPFTTVSANGWQGAALGSSVSVTAGTRYWVVWDPEGGEQASLNNDPADIQQPYWGSWSGDVNGGTSWFGPFSHSSHRWKFRMTCGDAPCDGNNHADTSHLDTVSMGNVTLAVAWTPAVTADITRLEVYTGEQVGSNAIGIWSDLASAPSAPLGWSSNYVTTATKGWQGADLLAPVSVIAGQTYWMVWETAGGEQAPVTNTGIQQTYWGSFAGTVSGGTSWFGPFSFTDRRWKFRAFCGDGPCDGNNHETTDYLDPVLMGGPMVGIEWTPSSSMIVDGIELYTGEQVSSNAVALWSDNGGGPGQPLATLGASSTYTLSSAVGWQGAPLTTPVPVTAGQTYWVVWDPAGGEQAPVDDDPAGIQQTYWGSWSGNVNGGASWFGPFSFSNRKWKFRLTCGKKPCGGNNYANNDHLDPVFLGGPMVGIDWTAPVSNTITRVEVYTGEHIGPNALAIWSSTGTQPAAPLAVSPTFSSQLPKGWQGADLISPVSVSAGTEYWVVWDPDGGEQSSLTDNPLDVQQTYWGSWSGNVSGGASWFGPFSFTNRRWKFRFFCKGQGVGGGGGLPDMPDSLPGSKHGNVIFDPSCLSDGRP